MATIPSTASADALAKLGDLLAETTWREGAQVTEMTRGNAKIYTYGAPDGETELPVTWRQQLELSTRAAFTCVRNDLMIRGVPYGELDYLANRVVFMSILRVYIASAKTKEQRLRLLPQIKEACSLTFSEADLAAVGNTKSKEWSEEVAPYATKAAHAPCLFAHGHMRLEWMRRTQDRDRAEMMMRMDAERMERKRSLAELEAKQEKARAEERDDLIKTVRKEQKKAHQESEDKWRGALAEERAHRLSESVSTATSLCAADKLIKSQSSQMDRLHTSYVTSSAAISVLQGEQASHASRHDRTESRIGELENGLTVKQMDMVDRLVEEKLEARLGTPSHSPVSSTSTTPVHSAATPYSFVQYSPARALFPGHRI